MNTSDEIRSGLKELLGSVLRIQPDDDFLNRDDWVRELFLKWREGEQARLRYEETVDQMRDCLFQLDLHGNCIFLSPAWPHLTGFSLDGAIGEPFASFFHPDSTVQFAEWLGGIVSSDTQSLHYYELKNQQEDHPCSMLGVKASLVLNENGLPVGIRGVLLDETVRTQLEENLRLVASAFENTSEGIMITDATPRILKINNAFSRMTGYTEEEVIGKSPNLLSSGMHDSSFYENFWRSLREHGLWRGEIWNRRKDGTIFPELLCINALKNTKGDITHYVALLTDISSVKDAENLANIDPLTQLPDRSVFHDRLHHAMALAESQDRKIGVFCVDLDNFKSINDSFGHTFGDEILRKVAERLSSLSLKGETLSRLGGDEFVLIVENIQDTAELTLRAETFLQGFRDPFVVDGNEFFLSSSMGISVYPDDGVSSEILLKHADTAMYKAKEQGRNHFQFYLDKMNEEVMYRLLIESRLHRAIEEDELYMDYQPQIDLTTGEMKGAEALIRWKNEKLGLISPVKFIPLAEENGLIVKIGEWAIQHSCQEIANHPELPPHFCISVNLSARQLRNEYLIDDLKNILASSTVPPERVELELTESVLVEDPEYVREVLQQVRDLGVGVAIDDFGTGYSSFSYLKRFPISKLKIDRSFIKDLPHSTEDAAIVKSMIALAHNLGMKVVAEGVENKEQVEFLILAQCDMAQGYFFSRPESIPNLKHFYDLGIF